MKWHAAPLFLLALAAGAAGAQPAGGHPGGPGGHFRPMPPPERRMGPDERLRMREQLRSGTLTREEAGERWRQQRVARLPERPFCVGFAAESHDLLRHASEKRVRKNVPLLVGNLGPATFGQDTNALLLVDAQGHRELPQADKLTLARQLVADIAQRL